jgi:hypothetical protein
MKSIDVIYPNQVIKLPIYSPQLIRMPIEQALKKTEPAVTASAQKPQKRLSLRRELRDIFDQIGEEWVDAGEQFIPLNSGGHVQLKADSFPTLNLRNGRMLIIDLHNKLPQNIAQLIESNWQEYKVVHLAAHDNLKTALEKIFAASGYHDVRMPGEVLKLRSDIDITLAGDWVIIPQKGAGNRPESIIALNLIDSPAERTPMVVRRYLKKMGISVIDYPDFPSPEKEEDKAFPQKIPLEKESPFPLPALLLQLAGQLFSTELKIPVFQKGETSFNLVVHADLFFRRGGSDCIIDTTGISPNIIDLLTEHQFRVLTLADEKDPCTVTELVLGFLGVPFDAKPHEFPVSARNESRNIMLTLHGISFYDKKNRKILAAETELPVEVAAFLNQRGYHVLELGKL